MRGICEFCKKNIVDNDPIYTVGRGEKEKKYHFNCYSFMDWVNSNKELVVEYINKDK